MTSVNRILRPIPVETFDDYLRQGGAVGLRAAADLSPDDIVSVIEASGLRGRGGAGFPTGTKWRTVIEMTATEDGGRRPVSVVVNGAEGEPGSFKDRTLLTRDPFQVVEGALIAARAVGSDTVVVAVKQQFTHIVERVRAAIDGFVGHGVSDVHVELVTGPSSYLFGEESALLEVVDGRPPLPRVTPPYRRGIGDVAGDRNASSDADLAGDGGSGGSPALVNNVETFANVTFILANGVEEFRSMGTPATPGTSVCTLSGEVAHHGVAEFAMGTPFWDVLDELGGGAVDDRTIIGAISGTANEVFTADRFDTPLCFDAFRDAGTGLGAAGFIVFDDHTDLAAVAHGVARFLAIESCGQCEPCKLDGGAIADRLDEIRLSETPTNTDLDAEIARLMTTVADGARCGLAGQQQTAVASLHALARTASRAHLTGELSAAHLALIAPITDIVDGVALVDRSHLDKERDWSTGGDDSGAAPADIV